MSGKRDFAGIAITLAIMIAFTGVIGYFMFHRPAPQTGWGAQINITLCGQQKNIEPTEWIDVENGQIKAMENNTIIAKGNITLGEFFDGINVNFDADKIYNYTNGDLCENKSGKVKMKINGKPREDFRNHLPQLTKDIKDQQITLVFEP